VSLSILHSYAYRDAWRPLPEGTHTMLDSGGFTAWSRGETITVEGLAAWYAAIDAERYAALDVIYDPDASRANALAMRDLGADVMPAIHAGTHPREVDRLAADGFTRIALGGMVNKANSWPDACAWAHACLDRADRHGMTAHGFGLSPARDPARLALTMRFDTIDSSTWQLGRYPRTTPLWDGRRLAIYNFTRDRVAIGLQVARGVASEVERAARVGVG